MKIIKNKIVFSLIITLTMATSMLAQFDDPGFGHDGDPGAAPINDYIWVLALVGLTFAFFIMKKYAKQLSK